MTNADKIRNATDEELVRYLVFCPVTSDEEDCIHSNDDGNCVDCVREWLQSEAKEGD